MTNILFRGKQMISGSWVEGDLFHNDNELFPMTMIGHVICSRNKHDGTIDLDGYYLCEVDPETVGQYTGLVDKNGKQIFEGDIIDCWSEGLNAKGVVRQRKDGLWIMYPSYQHRIMWGLCPDECGRTTVEVIGNIHDNPELLR